MKSDILNIRVLFGMGKILGVTPLWMQDSKLSWKIYITSLVLLVTFGTFLSIQKRYVTLSDLDIISADEALLEMLECFSEMFFMLSCFSAVLCKGKAWEGFFKNFIEAEEQLQRLNFRTSGNICVFVMRLAVINLTFFAVHAYEIVVWEAVPESSIEYGYILYRISMYYQCFVIYLTLCITEMLKKRYLFLNKLVKDILKEKNIIISTKKNRRAMEKLTKIQETYTVLYNVVQNFNFIFGWTLFIYFVTFVINILVNLNVVLKYSHKEDVGLNFRMLIAYVVYSIVYVISTVAIVMSCDCVEQGGKIILKTCFLYQELTGELHFKQELALFMRITKDLAPSCSAAGFFIVNQRVLSTFFSAVITYLIIVIQFNISL